MPPVILRQLFDRMPFGVSVWHLSDRAPPNHLTLLDANPSALASLGAVLDQAVGRSLGDLAPAEDYPEGLLATMREGGVRFLGQLAVTPPGGDPVSLEVLAVPLGADEVALVSHRTDAPVRASDLTQAARLALRRVLDALPDGIATLREGRVTRANRRLLAMLGHDDEDLVGLALERLVRPESQATVATQLAVAERGRPSMAEATLMRRDGAPVPVELHLVHLDLDGPLVFAVIHDLTERRMLMAKAMEHDRLTALGTLAAGLSHEMNNPLAYLTANLDFVREELAALGAEGQLAQVPAARLAELDAALADARDGAERVVATVADVKAFARTDFAPAEVVDLVDVLDVCLDLAANEIRHRAGLVRRVPEGPVPVPGDRGRLGQVLLPILVNAAQAIPAGDAAGHQITVTLKAESDLAVLTVQDTGEGMTEAVRRRLFDPFFTTRPQGRGTGLGLSVAHGIVTGLGGSLAAESVPGAGTTVTIQLPVRTPARAAAVSPRSATPAPARRGRILVVDDEAMIGLAVRRTLAADHEVVVTNRAADALARLADGTRFDVILCDLMMPEVTGMDLWARVAPEVRPRILFLTGGAFTDEAEAFLEDERPPVMTKPFDTEALRAEVARRLAEDDD